MKRPECLHIPPLYEGKTAQISWGVEGQDTNYIIERVFNETFTQALTGMTWANYNSTSKSWNQYDQDSQDWRQIELQANRGHNWERLEYEKLNWNQVEHKSQTWQDLECQETDFEIFRGQTAERIGVEQGYNWFDFEAHIGSWRDLEANDQSWREGELVMTPGLSWDSIDARLLTFDEWERKSLTFYELDNQEGIETHQGMADPIMIGATSAIYRIKAQGSDGNESDYLTTEQLPVIPIFYRSSVGEYPVTAGKRYRILMRAQEVCGFDKIRMNLNYNQNLLELTNFAAHSSKAVVKPGKYPEEQLDIYSNVPGKVWFQSLKMLNTEGCFSGSIALVEFIAKGNGIATISLT